MSAALDPNVTAALIAAGVSLVGLVAGKLWLDRRAHRVDLASEYEHEQRRALRALIGRHHGGLLEHATAWHFRMSNIYANVEQGWLNARGDYTKRRGYLDSTVYRSLALMAQAQRFEDEQIFIDARVAEPQELDS